MLKIGHWTTAVAAIFLMGSMGRPREAFAYSSPALETTGSNNVFSVVMLTERPLPAGLHDTGFPRIHYGESDLDHVFADISNPEAAIAQDTADNFVGRITVQAKSSYGHTTH